jgi:hypothetical protein
MGLILSSAFTWYIDVCITNEPSVFLQLFLSQMTQMQLLVLLVTVGNTLVVI